jgi:ribosomal protein S12 methylthiotransferase
VRLHYVYPYPHVDELLPLMSEGLVLPYLDVPFQHSHPDMLRRMKRPASGEKNLERLLRWREACPELIVRSTFIAGFPGETEEEFEHLLVSWPRPASTAPAASPIRRWKGAAPTSCRRNCRRQCARSAAHRFMAVAEAVSIERVQRRVGQTLQVLIDSAPALGRKGGVGRSFADAPEIDGTVRLLPPEKASKTLKVGEFTKRPRGGHRRPRPDCDAAMS